MIAWVIFNNWTKSSQDDLNSNGLNNKNNTNRNKCCLFWVLFFLHQKWLGQLLQEGDDIKD